MGRPALSAAEKMRRKAERESMKSLGKRKAKRSYVQTGDSTQLCSAIEPQRDLFLTQKALELSILCNQQSQKIDSMNTFVTTLQNQVNQSLQNVANRLQVLEKEVLTPMTNQVSATASSKPVPEMSPDLNGGVVNERNDLGLS